MSTGTSPRVGRGPRGGPGLACGAGAGRGRGGRGGVARSGRVPGRPRGGPARPARPPLGRPGKARWARSGSDAPAGNATSHLPHPLPKSGEEGRGSPFPLQSGPESCAAVGCGSRLGSHPTSCHEGVGTAVQVLCRWVMERRRTAVHVAIVKWLGAGL